MLNNEDKKSSTRENPPIPWKAERKQLVGKAGIVDNLVKYFESTTLTL